MERDCFRLVHYPPEVRLSLDEGVEDRNGGVSRSSNNNNMVGEVFQGGESLLLCVQSKYIMVVVIPSDYFVVPKNCGCLNNRESQHMKFA